VTVNAQSGFLHYSGIIFLQVWIIPVEPVGWRSGQVVFLPLSSPSPPVRSPASPGFGHEGSQ
jgi:hypothetical protein